MIRNLIGLVILATGCSAGGGGDEPGSSAGGSGASGGSGGSAAGSAGTGGGAPACFEVGADCTNDENGCCDGATCIHTTSRPAVCAAFCSDDSECNTGCCATIDDGAGSVCAPVDYCAAECIPAGSTCAGQVDSCCVGSTCVVNELGTNCAANCTKDTDCVSGCCAPTENDVTVCSPFHYCE